MIEYTGIGNKRYSVTFRLLPSVEFSYLKYTIPPIKKSFVISFGWLLFSWRIEISKVLCTHCNNYMKDIAYEGEIFCLVNPVIHLRTGEFHFCRFYDEVKVSNIIPVEEFK